MFATTTSPTTRSPRTIAASGRGRRTARATAVVALTGGLLAAGTLVAAPAMARDDDQVVRRACGPIAQKLTLSPDDGGLEVEYELDQNRDGRAWDVTITRNGIRVAHVTRTTRSPSGSFEVRVRGAVGTWKVAAVQRGSGTRCTIAATAAAA